MFNLDVKNTLNSAPRETILMAVGGKYISTDLLKMLEAHLSRKSLEVCSKACGPSITREITLGVPLYSVIRFDLWNHLYDNLMRISLPSGAELITFADDIAVDSTVFKTFRLEASLKDSFQLIDEWMTAHGLTLAAETPDAIVLTKKMVHNKIFVFSIDHIFWSKSSLRYLGVQIDKKLGLAEHADLVLEKRPLRRDTWNPLCPTFFFFMMLFNK